MLALAHLSGLVVLDEIQRLPGLYPVLRVQPRLEPSFWGAHSGAELDLLLRRGTRLWGFEAKLGDAPRLDRSLRGVLETLEVEHLWVVGPHDVHYDLAERISVVGLAEAVGICKNLA